VPGASESRNTLILDATIAQRDPLRYTPAGIPAVDCTLQHTSTQAEAGGERKVECELFAVAFNRLLFLQAGLVYDDCKPVPETVGVD